MCVAARAPPLWIPGDPRTAWDEFEVLLRRYSALSGEDVSESLKVALVQKGITGRCSENSPCPARLTPLDLPAGA